MTGDNYDCTRIIRRHQEILTSEFRLARAGRGNYRTPSYADHESAFADATRTTNQVHLSQCRQLMISGVGADGSK